MFNSRVAKEERDAKGLERRNSRPFDGSQQRWRLATQDPSHTRAEADEKLVQLPPNFSGASQY